MGRHDKHILKFLAKNAGQTPTITDMMMRLKMNISDITSTLDSLLAQGLVGKRLNGQGIECWFPANQAPSGGGVDFTLPATDSKASNALPMAAYPPIAMSSGGVGMGTFLIGLLIVGAASAWIGGKILARDTVKSAAMGLVELKAFNEAVSSWTTFEEQAKTRVKALEATVQGLTAAVDSLKAVKTEAGPAEKETPQKAPPTPTRRRR